MKTTLLSAVEPRLKDRVLKSRDLSLSFCSVSNTAKTTMDMLPVYTDHSGPLAFDIQSYWNHLATDVLGQVVMYADVVNSTMRLFDGSVFLLS